jgi:hypothetical protein
MSNEGIDSISPDGPEAPIEFSDGIEDILQTSNSEIEPDLVANGGYYVYREINGSRRKVWVAG